MMAPRSHQARRGEGRTRQRRQPRNPGAGRATGVPAGPCPAGAAEGMWITVMVERGDGVWFFFPHRDAPGRSGPHCTSWPDFPGGTCSPGNALHARLGSLRSVFGTPALLRGRWTCLALRARLHRPGGGRGARPGRCPCCRSTRAFDADAKGRSSSTRGASVWSRWWMLVGRSQARLTARVRDAGTYRVLRGRALAGWEPLGAWLRITV
mmetsp:Transcript_7072/g.24132  ORF Transcript_7072/g.24132 Transcript_7072/m.24132 type:complete len:209 (+) Transcript_7072:452-1078(+)